MKQFDLTGRVALVTGASRGIGRATAVALAEAGADLVLTARSEGGLKETAGLVEQHGRRALIVTADATDGAQIDRAVATAVAGAGHIDILVNNAGMQLVKPFLDYTPAEWTQMITTNVNGALHYTHAVGRHMVERKGGCIIDMGSIYGAVGAPGTAIYCLTKGALMSFTRSLATEWARYNIRINAICPGWIKTALTEEYMQDEKTIQAALRGIPMRRFGLPEDVAPMAVFLASDAAAYITGQFFFIDGGQTAR